MRRTILIILGVVIFAGAIYLGLYLIPLFIGSGFNPAKNEISQKQQQTYLATKKQIGEKTADCFKTSFRMAFILLGQTTVDITDDAVSAMETLKNNFHKNFSEATENLASIDTSYPTVTLTTAQNSSFTAHNVEGPTLNIMEIIRNFYRNHPDDFDFISLYTTFESEKTQYHITVKNNITGNGQQIVNRTALYGSKGELLGFNVMGTLKNSLLSGSSQTSQGLLHETGHQWCCYIGVNFRSRTTDPLPILMDQMHYYRGLSTFYAGGTPMGADYWEKNIDGTYKRSNNSTQIPHYHPFTLYFMGLKKASEINESFSLFDAGLPPKMNISSATFIKNITINDVVAKAGQSVYCSNAK